MTFPAFFDTNVLFGAILNDVVLRMGARGLFRPLWSPGVLEELRRNLIKHGAAPESVTSRIEAMTVSFPDALVTGYEPLVAEMTCDSKDRHVLAAAVHAKAEVLVTFNVRDFPPESVASHDLEIVHPDNFLLDQLDLYPGPTLAVFAHLVNTYNSPKLSPDGLLLALARTVPDFSTALRRYLE